MELHKKIYYKGFVIMLMDYWKWDKKARTTLLSHCFKNEAFLLSTVRTYRGKYSVATMYERAKQGKSLV